jgi:hypothetical protein
MKIIILLIVISFSLFAQERVLLHIGRDGRQEAIPLKKGENPAEIISSRENRSSTMIEAAAQSNGMVERLQNYLDLALGTKFGFYHQDVALQWFKPNAGGKVKEFWWLNSEKQGNIKKGTIRAWLVDPRLATRPKNVITKQMGYYRDASDGDGLVTPFKPSIGNNQWFYKAIAADSSTWGFDPLGEEVKSWRPGNGLQVNLDSNKWQGIKLEEWGDSMFVKQDQLFGFTLSNDTKKSDIPVGGIDERMEILSWPSVMQAPYHSLKFYETASGVYFNGWYLRGDYDWGMYVLIEYTTDRSPSISVPVYSTTMKTTPRTITATITDDNPGGGPAGIKSARLFRKKGSIASYDSTAMTASGDAYSALAPAGNPGDTIYWYITATDVNGNWTKTASQTFKIFQKQRHSLLVYNNAQFPLGNNGVNLIYVNSSNSFDKWSIPNDGTDELVNALKKYYSVYVVDGSFPRVNVMPFLKQWMLAYIGPASKQLLISSQDYGAMIQPSGHDTTFPDGSFEKEYLGIAAISSQNLGPNNKPYQITPSNRQFKYIDPFRRIRIYMSDSSVTLWHHPTYELGFSGYPDGVTPAENTEVVFQNNDSTVIHGVMKTSNSYWTMFLGFDAGALDFRSDTSKSPQTDPHYAWIADNPRGSIGEMFLYYFIYEVPLPEPLGVTPVGAPYVFDLHQNYPNPFNPRTTIGYEIASYEHVTIKICTILGQSVGTLVDEMKDAGRYTVSFDGRALSSGIYFYEMRAGKFVSSKKMLLLK